MGESLLGRPFGQPNYPLGEIKLDSLAGFAYKFTLFLPITFRGERIFSEEEESHLRRLLNEDFGGCTYTRNVTHPLIAGEWLDPQTGLIIINEHSRFEVYAKQSTQSEHYFSMLARQLEAYSQTVIAARISGYTGEAQILIEMVSVKLL